MENNEKTMSVNAARIIILSLVALILFFIYTNSNLNETISSQAEKISTQEDKISSQEDQISELNSNIIKLYDASQNILDATADIETNADELSQIVYEFSDGETNWRDIIPDLEDQTGIIAEESAYIDGAASDLVDAMDYAK